MYAGRIVEEGPVEQIFKSPQHPYTWSLLRSVPRVDEARKDRLVSIKGLPPDLSNPPPGCKFHPRCPFVIDKCKVEPEPQLGRGRGEPGRALLGADAERQARRTSTSAKQSALVQGGGGRS